MNAVAEIERNHSGVSLYAPDMSEDEHIADAVNGSRMLRNAILRAKGYDIPKLVIPPRATPIIFFRERIVLKERKCPRGRPKGSRKAPRVFPKIAKIQALISAHFNLTEEEMLKRSRSQRYSHPRQIAMYLSRKTTPASYPEIAKLFGGLDHTTVIHAVREVEKRVSELHVATLEAIVAVHKVIGA